MQNNIELVRFCCFIFTGHLSPLAPLSKPPMSPARKIMSAGSTITAGILVLLTDLLTKRNVKFAIIHYVGM